MKRDIHHQPLKAVLDRDMAIAGATKLIDKWSPYLEELVNYATGLLARSERSMADVKGTPSSVVILYHHVIQMADGIQATCSLGCSAAVTPMLRSLWEGAIYLEYITQEDFEGRSTAWMAHCHAKTRSFLESLDPSTERGQAVQAMRKKDAVHGHLDIFRRSPTGLSDGLRDAENKLEREKFKSALEDMTNTKGKLLNWYSINGGPRSLEQLANKLGKPLEYEFLFRHFSEISHAQSVSRAITLDQGTHYMAQMRDGANAESAYIMTTTFLIQATKIVAKILRPDESVDDDITEIVRRHRPEALRS